MIGAIMGHACDRLPVVMLIELGRGFTIAARKRNTCSKN
jgi:hypothetical protein